MAVVHDQHSLVNQGVRDPYLHVITRQKQVVNELLLIEFAHLSPLNNVGVFFLAFWASTIHTRVWIVSTNDYLCTVQLCLRVFRATS